MFLHPTEKTGSKITFWVMSNYYHNTIGGDNLIYTVLIVSLVIIICNFIGCAYIILRTYLRWRKSRSAIPMSLRFPYYIALTGKLGYGAAYREPLESPACEVISSLLVFSTALTIHLVAAISVTTWLRVVREVNIDFGKYDYKLWVPVFSIAIIDMSLSVRGTPKQKYWCAPDESNEIFSTMIVVSILSLLSIIIFCYLYVLILIKKADHNSSISNGSEGTTISNSLLKDKLERKVYKKVMTYILVFILQYTSALINKIANLLNHKYELLAIIALV
ncbi:6056_t:CDS:2, partial [Entrophospora sp. SA101]